MQVGFPESFQPLFFTRSANAFSATPGVLPSGESALKDVSMEARLTPEGEVMQEGLSWRVFSPIPGVDGKLRHSQPDACSAADQYDGLACERRRCRCHAATVGLTELSRHVQNAQISLRHSAKYRDLAVRGHRPRGSRLTTFAASKLPSHVPLLRVRL